jgi:hypothetical protein
MQTETREQALDYARRMIAIHQEISGQDEALAEVRELFDLEDFPVDPNEQPGGRRAREQELRDKRGG